VPSNRLLLGIVLSTAIVGGCGGDAEPATEPLLDERAGSYRGVEFGMSEQDVRRVLGEPGEGEGFVPLDEEFGDVGGPPAVRNWPRESRATPKALLYDGVAFLVGTEGVYAILVTEPAHTRRRVAIGDDLARARRAYDVGCGEGVGGERLGGGVETYPTCRGTIDGRIRIWFGEDPIRSIAIARVAE
jgi:hypothetical protein